MGRPPIHLHHQRQHHPLRLFTHRFNLILRKLRRCPPQLLPVVPLRHLVLDPLQFLSCVVSNTDAEIVVPAMLSKAEIPSDAVSVDFVSFTRHEQRDVSLKKIDCGWFSCNIEY
jgi:hypothetical protein